MIQQKSNSGSDSQQLSRFNLGIQAFQKILNLFDNVTMIGHRARKRFKDKRIIEYLCVLETLYITVSPVLHKPDKEFIEKEIKILKRNISSYNGTVKGNRVELVERLTQLEQRFYNSIQDINMYIQLKFDFTRTNRRKLLTQHLEGGEIPELNELDDEL